MAWNFSHLTNITNESLAATSTNASISFEGNFFFAIFIPTLCFFISIGNLGTIIAFWKLPSMREKPSELLILSLSCGDFITGFIVIPLFSPVYITPGYWPFKEITCRIFIFFMDLAVHVSLFSLCMISIDRLLLVLKEYPQYMKIQTHPRIQITLAIGWTISMITGFIEVSLWNIAKRLDKSAGEIDYTVYCLSPPRRMQEFALPFFLLLYLFPVLLVCGLSTAFFCLLYKRLSKSWGMRAESQLPHSSSSSSSVISSDSSIHHQRNRYVKPAITLLALVSAMALCMLPYTFHVLAVEVFCPECADYHTLYSLLLLQFCNACLDPFMYAMTQRKIQKFYKLKLNKMKANLRYRRKESDKPLAISSKSTSKSDSQHEGDNKM